MLPGGSPIRLWIPGGLIAVLMLLAGLPNTPRDTRRPAPVVSGHPGKLPSPNISGPKHFKPRPIGRSVSPEIEREIEKF